MWAYCTHFIIHYTFFSYLWLNLNWFVRNCLTAFLPFQFICHDSWWAWRGVAIGWGNKLPLRWSSVIQETLNREQRIREGYFGSSMNIFNRHQRLFFSTLFFPPCKKLIFLAEYLLQSLSYSLSISTNAPNLLILFLHQQVMNQLWCSCQRFSAHSFAGTVFLFACHR